MNNRIILTVQTKKYEDWKDCRLWECCQKVQKAYAKKNGADYKIITENDIEIMPKGLDKSTLKLQHLAWLLNVQSLDYNKKYRQVLYLDSDVLITPWAPDIFEVYPETDIYRALQMKGIQYLSTIPYQQKYNIEWKKNGAGVNIYYNTAVQLFGKDCNFEHNIDDYIYGAGHDEPYITSIIMRNKVNHDCLDCKWNFQDYDKGLPTRYDAYFIHYGGQGFSGIDNKNDLKAKEFIKTEIAISDYKLLYGEK